MAGSVNIAAQRTLSANITIITIKVNTGLMVPRWPSGLMNSIGGGLYAPAAASAKT
jgi:hypothetical protein